MVAWAAGDDRVTDSDADPHEVEPLTAVQILSAPGGEGFEPQVAAEDGPRSCGPRLRVQGAFRAEHRKSFGSARTLSAPRLHAFEPDAVMDDESNVFTAWRLDA